MDVTLHNKNWRDLQPEVFLEFKDLIQNNIKNPPIGVPNMLFKFRIMCITDFVRRYLSIHEYDILPKCQLCIMNQSKTVPFNCKMQNDVISDSLTLQKCTQTPIQSVTK